jgi:hypothetical protein
VEQLVQVVSEVAAQDAVWYWPPPQAEHMTHIVS